MSEKQGKILIVDDDEDILVAGKLLLKRHYASVETCNNPECIPDLLASDSFDAILLDMNFGPGESSGAQGFVWLKKILEIDPQAVVVMITAHGGVGVAVEAMKQGATDFVAKPWQNEKMVATLSASVKLRQSRSEADALKKTNRTLAKAVSEPKQPILGDSKPMRDVLSMIERAAPTDANVLILGENGTGKELVARELHRQSNRADQVFMSVDLGAVTESLFESELFGHKKGAFTDARDDRIGRLQAAEGGTLFLDEIGNLPLHLQAKLLTVLEQRYVTPVGSDKRVPINVRVIAATNVAPDKLRSEEVFRQDLLFRLNTVEIHLPPLRDRPEDIPEIAQYYAGLYCRKYGRAEKTFTDDAMAAIKAYSWPGNVRALRHALERAVILSEADAFTGIDFQFEAQPNQPGAVAERSTAPAPSAEPAESADDLNLERLERNAIAQALKIHRYNISHAAKDLGLTRAALYRRMEKHGL
ncbi:sigma-54-dependent transcriptional regulator [Kordiimonas lacus]|uniref:DNA-binding transcriptional response regulator, NtrC family, contains REC, AAA-type ATPase, and a Fis-type DNA-binding domains n=1 Tax=Kordiimonas lacus TaxID=637679 RepID=A0A1G6ZUK4_9PROT|nr:sigma-54 dependent transcriptional regulator [Kordiimonas lacus]SDE06190.1 DNA-binding transcriptional response regulator, NtrC family, contains REC, AAA-type ATPase, and a Fis-type DNA-binding domains [Kordiimonas lacus]